jgi:hypothetical protein
LVSVAFTWVALTVAWLLTNSPFVPGARGYRQGEAGRTADDDLVGFDLGLEIIRQRLRDFEEAGIDLRGHDGITGSVTREGCSASENTVCSATTMRVCRPTGSPVFGLRSSRGKFDDEMSIRILWPRAKRLLVGGSGIATL